MNIVAIYYSFIGRTSYSNAKNSIAYDIDKVVWRNRIEIRIENPLTCTNPLAPPYA